MQLAMETGGAEPGRGHAAVHRGPGQGPHLDDRRAPRSRSAATSAPRRARVVFQNELIQLIQYTPTTDQGLQAAAGRSCRRASTSTTSSTCSRRTPSSRTRSPQGHTVFLVSWRNAGPEQGQLTWDDYLEQGVLQAIDVGAGDHAAPTRSTRSGFCIGGTLLASALAVRPRAASTRPPA